MEGTESIKDIRLLKIGVGLLFGLVMLPTNLKAIAILLFGVSVLVHSLRRRWYFNKTFFFTNAVLFIALALTFFYSEDQDYARRKLQTMASLIVFPFVFAMITKEESEMLFKDLKSYLWIYVLGVFLMNVIPFIYFWINLYDFKGMMVHFHTLLRVDMGKYSIHPIYVSMHCGVALLFSFYIIRELKSRIYITLIVAIDITIVLFLLMYAKKGPLIALIIVFSLFVVFQRNQKWLKPYLIAIVSLIALTILIPRTRNKFVELQHIDVLENGVVTSTNIRYTIYGIAKDLIAKAPIKGYGIGDYNNQLHQAYQSNGNSVLIEGSYNAHNQYFSLLLIGGIIAILAFVFMIGMNMVYALRFNNQILILLLVFYVLMMFTANILEREAGVIFVAFFLNFFGSKSLYSHAEEE